MNKNLTFTLIVLCLVTQVSGLFADPPGDHHDVAIYRGAVQTSACPECGQSELIACASGHEFCATCIQSTATPDQCPICNGLLNRTSYNLSTLSNREKTKQIGLQCACNILKGIIAGNILNKISRDYRSSFDNKMVQVGIHTMSIPIAFCIYTIPLWLQFSKELTVKMQEAQERETEVEITILGIPMMIDGRGIPRQIPPRPEDIEKSRQQITNHIKNLAIAYLGTSLCLGIRSKSLRTATMQNAILCAAIVASSKFLGRYNKHTINGLGTHKKTLTIVSCLAGLYAGIKLPKQYNRLAHRILKTTRLA